MWSFSEETTNLATIEASLKKYIQDRNQRDEEKNNREKLQKQLAASGLEGLYKQYRDYLKFKNSHKNTPYEPNDPNKIYFENALKKQYEELLESLKASGFTFESFGKLIAGYELAFRKETVHLAEDALMKYKHVLFGEKKKLLNDTFLTNLLEKIKASKAKESYLEADKAATPFYADKPNEEQREFKAKMEALARSKKAEGNVAIKNLSSVAPLVEDNGFNKEGFAKIETKQELHDFLEHYINDQEINIYRTLANLHKDQGLSIYGYGSLLQKSKEKQGIAQGSIFDLIITDKEDKESTKYIIDGLAIGVLAIALGLLTFGTGTVAVLFAAGNFALSAYLTYEEIDAYRTQLAAYKVDISKDEPSAVWVIISVAGSVLDAAAVAKISKTLVNAGRTFEETKDVAKTRKILGEAGLDAKTEEKVVKALEKTTLEFEEFLKSVPEFANNSALAKESYNLFKQHKWKELEELFKARNINGGWPPNRGGFDIEIEVLEIGELVDRYGGWFDANGIFNDKGFFVSPKGIPFNSRALPKEFIDKPYRIYEVVKPIKLVKKGKIIPWFTEKGLGIQYDLPKDINTLIKDGYLKLMKK